jgi:hypothetical protein
MLTLFYILAGWAVADAFGGLYHLATDRGYNLPFQVRSFQNHHDKPWTMTFDLEPLAGAVPLLILSWWLGWPAFLTSAAVGIGFTQIPHYYIHHPERCPRWIVWLQRARIVLQPKAHEDHHTPPYGHNFCILAGWNDWWINRLARATQ